MWRSVLLRAVTFALAFVHTFPARKHLLAFAASPSWSEGFKGFGAGRVARLPSPDPVTVTAIPNAVREP